MKNVEQILEAESTATQIVAKAHKQAEKIISKAKQDALAYIATQKDAVELENDDFLDSRAQEFEKQQAQIRKVAASQVTKIEKHAAKNMKEAHDLVLTTILSTK